VPFFLLWMIVVSILVFRPAGRSSPVRTTPGDPGAEVADAAA